MENVKVTRVGALAHLKANRITHKAEYEEAMEGWRAEAARLLKKALKDLKSTGKYELKHIPVPSEYLGSYDRAIAMLEMSVDDEIILTEEDFARYILDDWDWSRQFKVANSTYSSRR